MDILLITPDHENKKNNFPWAALSVGSYLSNVRNYDVKLLDGSVFSKTELLEKIKYYCNSVKLVGISCMSSDTFYIKGVIDYIKDINRDCKIILGGPHARLQPDQTCLYNNIDFVSYTEGEHTVSQLYEEIKSGNHRYDKVPGLIYKEGSFVRRTSEPELINFYDINYDLLPKSTRQTYHEYIQVLAGRGCSFRCAFCFNSVCGQTWRGRPVLEMINEIDGIVSKYDPKAIYFRDDNFFLSKKRVEEFMSYYRKKGYRFKWRANCFAGYYNRQYINYDFLKELESVNCETLKFGLESGSQRVINNLKKKIKVDNVKRLVDDLSKFKKIQGNYSFMIGLPGETYEEYKETMSLIKYILERESDAFVIGPNYFRVYPGGTLYDEIKTKYHYSEPKSFEEWAIKYNPEKDWFSFGKHIRYPWIPQEYEFFAQYADVIVKLSRKDFKKDIRAIGAMPFVILAKLRIKYEWYGYLYDLRIFVYLYKLILKLKSKFLTIMDYSKVFQIKVIK
jgi:anaerobic magnesium-protoporphyrin IX monomethyl ester cyclase